MDSTDSSLSTSTQAKTDIQQKNENISKLKTGFDYKNTLIPASLAVVIITLILSTLWLYINNDNEIGDGAAVSNDSIVAATPVESETLEVRESIVSFSREVMHQELSGEVIRTIEKQDVWYGEIPEKFDTSAFAQYIGNTTLSDGIPIMINYTERKDNKAASIEYIAIRDMGHSSNDLSTTIEVFKKYFQIHNTNIEDWKIVERDEDGIYSYEYVFPINPDGSFNTWSGFVVSNDDGTFDINVAACHIFPVDPYYELRTCFAE